mmetsp:Transcript_73170/g.65862  ORF Transcript_73170/g.65862 Transcript_73170/m.65862 type:complete len:466 (-) Transcript_73170:389-1786(-)
MSHGHKHGPNCSHGHGHHHGHGNGHNHSHQNFNEHHNHKPGCKHKHDNKSTHYGPNEHASNCQHKNHKNCQHGLDHKYKELTPKDYEKRRSRRKLRQWSRRGNHTLQNIIAAIWIWSLSDSQLMYYYENNFYDKLLIFHGLQLLSLTLFFIASLTEPGFLESNNIPNDTNEKLKKNEDEIQSLLSNTDDIDIENQNGIITVDPNNNPPPSFCRSCKFLRPIRSKHCYQCDRCVPRFDHHCPLIEQCVGAKNYRQFYTLCWAQFFVSGWSFYIAIECLFYNGWETEGQLTDSDNRSYIGWFWRIMLFLWMLYQAFMASSLVSFHTYLVCTQQTTFEFLKPKKLKERLSYENQQQSSSSLSSSYSVDILGDPKPKRKKRGIPGPMELMKKMCIGMGFCLCDYPFSQGFFRNWYGFVTAECLERPDYFKIQPVKLVKSEPKPDENNKDTEDIDNKSNILTNGNDVDKK